MRRLGTGALVFFLAAVAGMIRQSLLQWFPPVAGIPWTLILINFIGIVLLVLLVSVFLLTQRSFSSLQTGLTVGFLGGLTTLASPLLDLILLLQAGNYTLFAFLALIYLVGGFFLAFGLSRVAQKVMKGGGR